MSEQEYNASNSSQIEDEPSSDIHELVVTLSQHLDETIELSDFKNVDEEPSKRAY